jgi:tetratricopeptide (TPR) repeat protein
MEQGVACVLRLEVLDYVGPTQWRWRLTDDQGEVLADHPVELDADEWQLDAFTDLHRYLRDNAAPDRRLANEAELVVQVGAWLAERAMGPVALELARARGPVRLVVPAEAAELAYRPWELAMVDQQPLVAHRVTFVVDHQRSRVPKAPVGERLRMLGVFSAGQPLRKERLALAGAVYKIAKTHGKAVELRVLQHGATREQLRDTLQEADGWDVVHLSGHDLHDGLALADGLITGAELIELLDLAVGQLKLVALTAARSAAQTATEQLRRLGMTRGPKPSEAEPAGSLPELGSEIVRQLDCAVLAMRYPAVDDFAIGFAVSFYNLVLGLGHPVAEAAALSVAQVAGQHLTTSTPPLSVATPMLLGGRAMDLRLAPPDGEPLVFQVELLQRLPEFPEQSTRFVGRAEQLARASAALAQDSGRSGVVLHGMAGIGKTAGALELAYTDIESFVAAAWYVAPPDGSAIDSALTDCVLALERQLPGLQLAHRANDLAAWREAMPAFADALARTRVLIVLDDVESLLTDAGEWRDERWALFVQALTGHQGLARAVMTSRRRPAGLPATVLVEPVRALSLAETLLLAREWPRLRALLDGTVTGLSGEQARDLATRSLMLVHGHPKLIELADGRASDPVVLQARLDEADRVWERRDTPFGPFMSGGEPAATDEDYLAVLATWTSATTSALSPDASLLFDFLCCLEPDDRITAVVHTGWPHMWQHVERTGAAPDPDVTAQSLAERGLVAVDLDPTTGRPNEYRIEAGMAESGRSAVDPGFRDTVDAVVGDGWLATLGEAMSREEAEGFGQLVLRAARSAAPYLLRQHRWVDLDAAAEQVLHRDRSTATAVALLPLLATAASATEGTDDELAAGRTYARALAMVEPDRAQARFRAVLDAAVERGEFRQAAACAGDLITLYRDSGQWDQALELAEAKADYSVRADLGPWTRLGDDGQRLQILGLQGNYQQVLDVVEQHRATMATLPDPPDTDESVTPWNVREVILGIGVNAARELGSWQQALDLNRAIRESKLGREAGDAELAGTAFNDYGALLALGHNEEARDLLTKCRTVFEAGRNYPMLAKTLVAMADVEGRLGELDGAVSLGRDALRLAYVVVDPEAIAVGHHNLAAHLARTDADLRTILANLLTAALIRYQTGSGDLATSVQAVAGMLPDGQQEIGQLSFEDVCSIVDSGEGIHFAALFARLPARTRTGEDAVTDVLRLAGDLRSDVIAQTVDVWDPIVSALLAVRHESADLTVEDVDQVLTAAEEQSDWQELVPVLRRIQAGEQDPTLADNLNPVDSAIVRRTLGALAGTVDIDPNAWRALVEQA